MAESTYDDLCGLFRELLSANKIFPYNFYETKKVVSRFQDPFEKIDACVRSCMLYYKDDKNLSSCKFYGEPRYKQKGGLNRGLNERKSLFFVSLISRLRRLFQHPEIAKHMWWHKESKRVYPSVMTHPSDAKAWKAFYTTYPDFTQNARNVWLGLCTDGFSPFSRNSGKSYSCWLMILTPYNLPPHLCMKQRYLFLTCMFLGPRGPDKKIDVYLKPLVDELRLLWEDRVETFDVSEGANFQMRAALMWMVNNVPAYAMLSRWQTSEKLACLVYMDQYIRSYLHNCRKMTWFDCHRKFLLEDHPYRRKKMTFRKNFTEKRRPPIRIPGEQIINEQIYHFFLDHG